MKALGPQLGKLSSMHTLKLSSACCGLVAVFDEEACVVCVDRGLVHEQRTISARKERRHWVHSWASWRNYIRWTFRVRIVVGVWL